MWQEIIEVAAANGIWATMFLGLLIYQLRDNRNREDNYRRVIEKLTKDLNLVRDVKREVDDISENLTAYVFESGNSFRSAEVLNKEDNV